MPLVLLLIVVAIALGAIGLAVKALKWLLIISLIVFLAGAFAGWKVRRKV